VKVRAVSHGNAPCSKSPFELRAQQQLLMFNAALL
jgi:hypothetical protein